MNKNMKKLATIAVVAALSAGTCYARPHGGHHGGGPRPARVVRRPAPPPAHHHHHHSHGSWGRGGRNFWPGFVGGVVGGLLADAVVTPPPPVVVAPAPVVVPPPVVVSPTYVTQNVWVEGRYVDQVQSNGTVLRVWQPGHYEQRQVLIQ